MMQQTVNISYNDLAGILRARPFDALPGMEIQLEMAPTNRRNEIRARGSGQSPVKSSVLLLLYPGERGEPLMVFIQRPRYDGAHSGQIAFPGGRYESTDKDLEQTALREAQEEVGVDPDRVEVIGGLTPLYIPPSNYIVSPFVGLTDRRPAFVPDKKEVDRLLELPLSAFRERNNKQMRAITLSTGIRLQTPCFVIHGEMIWGATAMIMAEFLALTEGITGS